jgi:hypothetical protein
VVGRSCLDRRESRLHIEAKPREKLFCIDHLRQLSRQSHEVHVFKLRHYPGLLPSNGQTRKLMSIVVTRWDEKAGLRRDAVGSQIIDVLKAQEIKETGNEED